VSGPTNRYPAGPVLIKTLPGRPEPRPRPALARIMVRQHDLSTVLGLAFAEALFGPRVVAEELFERYRDQAKRVGQYRRDEAIDQAADLVGLDRDRFRHWMNRSRTSRSKRRRTR
jgi:hypothetical protein